MYRKSFTNIPSEEQIVAEKVRKSEWKLAICGLVFSASVITAKLICNNVQNLHDLVYERNLVTYEHVTESGQIMMRHVWEESIRHSGLWLPLVCGFIATYITWVMVYLDSDVPGVQPPSPLSPTTIKMQSGHTFHLNYVFAVLIGIFVTSYMYMKGINLGY
ncbi:PREDICTED: uncharacterized protein LOC108568424 [Nicrophorus vespilloides]|uniref:Uncharacterized protein LOC108568424 n=1 Tax=Nicrophorus vespilloides TaxID=110193 RepID=A0ABM1NDU0_NICVS|nr:PREDICTED: uncharacterized protein LOC108568424 [Nicrophorus vespilloides]